MPLAEEALQQMPPALGRGGYANVRMDPPETSHDATTISGGIPSLTAHPDTAQPCIVSDSS
jgi:hypothetical protein